MISSHYLLFLAASALLILTPGPAVLYIVTRSISQGRSAGLASTFGVGVGTLGHVLFAAAGLSAVLASSAMVFSAFKYVGAGYLIFLGLRKFSSPSMDLTSSVLQQESLRSVFGQGAMVGLLNPKTALFFLAFLPQFVVPAGPPAWAQLLALGGTFVAMAMVSDGTYALLSGSVAPWLRRRSILRFEKYMSGVVYCGLGTLTALSSPLKIT